MVKFDELLDEIRETRKQLSMTSSKQRKYELHRRLNKLVKEYRDGMRYWKEQQRKGNS